MFSFYSDAGLNYNDLFKNVVDKAGQLILEYCKEMGDSLVKDNRHAFVYAKKNYPKSASLSTLA